MKEAERKYMKKVITYQISLIGFFGTIPDQYELADKEGNTVIDHLSEAQVIALSSIL